MVKTMKKLAFIGVGNMASAIINGILSSGAKVASANDLVHFDRFETQCAPFAARGVEVAKSAPDAVKSAEYVLIAVKPQNLGELLDELSPLDLDNKTFISICAGVSTETISRRLGKAVPIVRCMPNTPLSIGLGVTAMSRNRLVSDAGYEFARGIFTAAGMVIDLDESQMNTVICVNGSSPAYFYYFIDAMVKSARAQGLDCDNIVEAVCRTIIGSAEMLMRSGKTPEELIRAVTSPKGTTEQAMNELYAADVASTIDKAMRACTERAEEMPKEFGI